VFGAGDTGGPGVIGTSKTWIGVFGETFRAQNGPAGVWADGHQGGSGVKGHTSCPGASGESRGTGPGSDQLGGASRARRDGSRYPAP